MDREYRSGQMDADMKENGSQFTGKFYLNRKEGYGAQVSPDGTTFQGLYRADQRFGPGVLTYPDGRQDVGLWHRGRLLRLCTVLEDCFTLRDFPEHMAKLSKKDPFNARQLQSQMTQPGGSSSMDPRHFTQQELLRDECFVLPSGTEFYSTDSDHLPIPQQLRRELDLRFFGEHYTHLEALSEDWDDLPLQQRMQAHIHRHRFEAEQQRWNVTAVLAMNREGLGPKGPLELKSERLIKEASLGNLKNVNHILQDKRIHPDVSDAHGHTALIAATVNCHNDIINMLLDSGVDVNKLNSEGMSPLAVCSVLYYPVQSLQETIAERAPVKVSKAFSTSVGSPPERSSENLTDRPKDEFDKKLLDLACQSDQNEENIPQNDVTSYENSDTIDQINENDGLSIDNPFQSFQDNNAESVDSKVEEDEELKEERPIQFLDRDTPVDLVPEHNKGIEIGTEDQKSVVDVADGQSQVDDPTFDSAASLASFHIQVTEEIMRETAEVLYGNGTVPPPDTQETLHRMALKKIEHQGRWNTMKLLLRRGADPNASSIPMPVLFLAIKAGHIEAVHLLLGCGARTDISLPPEQKGLYPLHIAAALPGDVGPKITEMLLHALADPDVKALDADEIFELDEAVDELLAGGADPNLPLTRQVNSALCAVANIKYDCGTNPRNRIKLLEKLVKAGANVLMPVMVGEGRKSSVGTAVDYAFHSFQQDWHIAHTPYHALNQREREVYNARRQLLGLMGDLVRQEAVKMERQRMEQLSPRRAEARSPSVKGRLNLTEEEDDSEGVLQEGESRCHEVFYCSKSCKTKAWNDRHKDECIRLPGRKNNTASKQNPPDHFW
ncbi:ankyrin repeat and MYND domain-containing protein 1 [Chanos chanos]|uniref:Ankyrin repeat and MYND domain-containing protein 1 n=1 Tax=Chanos chanos TaxID=29144 RepID=A0A6J2WQ70_CHACN|nr:ankyrin repeat and MYND domain-containing protein 1-like [Chanos chanos]